MIDSWAKKVVTNPDHLESDCRNCRRSVSGVCRINGCKPRLVGEVERERTNCGYWWPLPKGWKGAFDEDKQS